MGGIASKELVAAVSLAGGFGTWGCATAVANKDVDGLRFGHPPRARSHASLYLSSSLTLIFAPLGRKCKK
jgi:hypothetical protein